MSKAKADELGVTPLGEIVGYGQVAGPDPSLLTQPARAIQQAAERAGIAVGDIDLFELNEAFAAVGVASIGHLGIDAEVANVNGGATRSVTPWACPAPASPCTCSTSWLAVVAGWVRRPCAVVAGRATPVLVRTI